MNKPRLPKGLPGVIATNHHHISGKSESDNRRQTRLLIQQLTKPDISVSKHHHMSGKGESDHRRQTRLLIQQLTKPDIAV